MREWTAAQERWTFFDTPNESNLILLFYLFYCFKLCFRVNLTKNWSYQCTIVSSSINKILNCTEKFLPFHLLCIYANCCFLINVWLCGQRRSYWGNYSSSFGIIQNNIEGASLVQHKTYGDCLYPSDSKKV